MKDKNKNKRKGENTGSEARNGTKGLHFQNFLASRDIKQETKSYNTSFYTDTFNQIPSFCQDFSGVYERVGNTIKLSPTLVLKIQERKYETKNKPKEFLNLYRLGRGKLIFLKYISSLFRAREGNTYRFDYKGVYYTLRLTDTTAIINSRFLPLYTNRGKK